MGGVREGQCPACKGYMLPAPKGGDAVACQNAECRAVVSVDGGAILGEWTEGYGRFVATGREVSA